jgi:uncharacterized protein with FMN-binding domain
MRRITLWALSTLTTVVLLFSYHTSTNQGASVASATSAQAPAVAGSGSSSSGSGSSSGTDSSGTSSDSGTPDSTSGTSGSSGWTSGTKTYTGDSVDTRWGPVQVQITVTNGKITAAEAVVYPTENGRDVEINSYAVPALNDEAVQAQSASIDMVSGATVTSEGYLSSLQSAIDKANL